MFEFPIVRPIDFSAEVMQLRDGQAALLRPITVADGAALLRGLRRLSPAGHAYRFLQYRKRFSEAELHYLTHCDFVNHLALILAVLDDSGREIDQVGVARSIRVAGEPDLAEVAIVLVDDYQGLGGGTALLRRLAHLAWQTGIRRWQAFSLEDNVAGLHLLEKIGSEVLQRRVGMGAIETIYALAAPEKK